MTDQPKPAPTFERILPDEAELVREAIVLVVFMEYDWAQPAVLVSPGGWSEKGIERAKATYWATAVEAWKNQDDADTRRAANLWTSRNPTGSLPKAWRFGDWRPYLLAEELETFGPRAQQPDFEKFVAEVLIVAGFKKLQLPEVYL